MRSSLLVTGGTALVVLSCSASGASDGANPGLNTGGAGGAFSAPGSGGTVLTPSGGAPGSGATPLASGGTVPATGGTTPRDPGAFDWPEATADGGSAPLCKPGRYVGTYSCTVSGPAGAPGVGLPLAGPVELTLSQSQEGEFLVVSGGTLKTSAGFITLESGLVGKLSCQTGTFEGALENGQLSIPPLPPGGTAEGTLSGSFLPATSELDGTWQITGGTAFPGYGCNGPWRITWAGE